MKTKLLLISAALSCAFAGSAFAMTKAEYSAQKDRISGDYKVAKDKCASLKANAKDICKSEAKGIEKVAKAELEAVYEPSARHTEKAALAKGDAAYDTAKEKCDDLSGNAKTVCVKDAKAAYVTVKEEAKLIRAGAMTKKVDASMRKEATADEREANYKAAAARCDALSGAPKDACIVDAKTKFGMK